MSAQSDLTVFLKLGGSLITDKEQPHTTRPEVIQRLAGEIKAARESNPHLRLLLGHGSGSFGHIPAKKYRTRRGVRTRREWSGFLEVWRQAGALNRIVMAALHKAGLPAIAFPASSSLIADEGRVELWELGPIQSALRAGLLPVVYGDVVFDRSLGGTILSTEDLFRYLCVRLMPARILLAGLEAGVWADFPGRTTLVEEVTPRSVTQYASALGGAAGADVTGGMAGKVYEMLHLAEKMPGLEVRIFSGQDSGAVQRALAGQEIGTLIRAD